MKPSKAFEKHRHAIRQIVSANRALNPRVFGSVLRGQDTDESDLDILVDALAPTVSTPVKETVADGYSERGSTGACNAPVDTAQRFVRTVLAVVDQPLISDGLDLLQVGKPMRVEHFGAIRSVETLDEDILIRLARLDAAHRGASGGDLFNEGLRDHLGAIVPANRIGHPTPRLRAELGNLTVTHAKALHRCALPFAGLLNAGHLGLPWGQNGANTFEF